MREHRRHAIERQHDSGRSGKASSHISLPYVQRRKRQFRSAGSTLAKPPTISPEAYGDQRSLKARLSALQSTGSCLPAGIRLAVGRVVLNDLSGRNEHPVVLQPRVPAILGIPFVTLLDLEFRLDGVSDPAAEQRFRVCLAMRILVVVRALEIFEPRLVGAVRPLATGEKLCSSSTSTIAAIPAAILCLRTWEDPLIW